MLSLEIIIIYLISFLSLFFAFVWICTLALSEEKIVDIKEIKEFPFISMIIPAWNEEEMISETINSLLAVDYPKNKYEIIVVANNCTDKTADVVRTFKDRRVKLLEFFWDKSKFINNKSHAENLALSKAKGDIIGIMDADSIVKSDIFKFMVPYFQNEEVGAVISTVKVYKPKNFLEKIQWVEFLVGDLLKKLMSLLEAFFITSGACNLYRKNIVQKIGGFSEDSITEDAEIATRMLYNKYKVISQIEAIVYARAARTFRAFHTQRLRWNRGLLNIIIKYRDIMFNKKYGALGFIFPLYLLIFGILILVDILIILNIGRLVYNIILFFMFEGNIGVFSYPILFAKHLLIDANIVFAVPALAILFCGAYLLIRSHKFLKESSWKYPFATVIFLTLYQMVMAMYWLLAMIYEAIGTKKIWRGKARW